MSRSAATNRQERPQSFDTEMFASWSAALALAFVVIVSLGVIFALDRSVVAIGLVAISALTKAGIGLMIRA